MARQHRNAGCRRSPMAAALISPACDRASSLGASDPVFANAIVLDVTPLDAPETNARSRGQAPPRHRTRSLDRCGESIERGIGLGARLGQRDVRITRAPIKRAAVSPPMKNPVVVIFKYSTHRRKHCWLSLHFSKLADPFTIFPDCEIIVPSGKIIVKEGCGIRWRNTHGLVVNLYT